MTPAVLRMRGVRKTFGVVVALDGVDLDVAAGEVHGLIGENGAGKSTLMKVLSGAHRPDGGAIELAGISFRPAGPADARRRGVAMIYQELNLAPHLTVEENVMLGRERRCCGVVRRREMRADVRRALDVLRHPEISPRARVADLGPGPRQLVEIARALVGDVRVLVLDEPTSSLSRRDSEQLFAVVRRLRDRGVAIVYISHFLEEVKQVGDRFTVLRDGRSVGSGEVASTPVSALIQLMVGRDIAEVFPRVPHVPGEVVLRVDSLAGELLPRSAGFELRRGEILGIAGLVGAGRTELVRALFGLDPVRRGEVTVARVRAARATPARRLAQGLGMLSEDRREEGLALGLSIAANATLSRLGPFGRGGWLSRRRQGAAAAEWLARLDIRARDPWQPAAELSGGSQQKVALARLLHHDVDVLLLDEPTRGIDVASKVAVYRLIGELAARGKAILMVSSYLPELRGVCDRIAVMHRGVLGAARPAAARTESEILDEATRGARG
ncbi:MAG: sugar ABC transporter ATP-binding protein [Planctomycetota bacterium]